MLETLELFTARCLISGREDSGTLLSFGELQLAGTRRRSGKQLRRKPAENWRSGRIA
jgi:hypothetical protein